MNSESSPSLAPPPNTRCSTICVKALSSQRGRRLEEDQPNTHDSIHVGSLFTAAVTLVSCFGKEEASIGTWARIISLRMCAPVSALMNSSAGVNDALSKCTTHVASSQAGHTGASTATTRTVELARAQPVSVPHERCIQC